MDRPPSTVSWKRLLSKLWWKHNWKWAVPVAGLALLLFGPVLLVVIPLVYLGVRQSRKHTAKLRHVCEVLGFAFEDTEVRELGARFGDFPHFALSGGTGRGLMTGSLAEHPVTVMEHFYGIRSKYSETLAVFPDGAKGLPDFELAPGLGALGEKIQAVFGYQDINFSENEEFSKHYELRGTNEAGIRRTFDATMLAFFAANQGWSVQTRGGAAMIFRGHRLYAPAEVPGFLAEALNVLGELTRR
ncbi:MAG: hypothetical protein Q8Q85_00295 [Gemmatimonadales bacterium]|nr:hypothetical protein [Gemmatimonadales bacterium]